jgi:hypothetical protein
MFALLAIFAMFALLAIFAMFALLAIFIMFVHYNWRTITSSETAYLL